MVSTRSKYLRFPQKLQMTQTKPQNQIRLTGKNKNRDHVYINRGYVLFLDQKQDTVIIKAAQRVIPNALKVAEILKKRIPGLHQVYKISGITLVDRFVPIQKGLDQVKLQKIISVIQIKLTKTPTAEDKQSPGYQSPVIKTDPLTSQQWNNIKKRNDERRKRYQQNKGQKRQDRGQRRGGYRNDNRRDDRRDDRRDNRRDDRRDDRRQDRRDDRRQDRRDYRNDNRRRQDRRQGSRDYRKDDRRDQRRDREYRRDR